MGPNAARPGYAHSTLNGSQHNGPPPSTYAAQIVDTLTKARQQPKPDERELFQQLLREILGAGEAPGPRAETVETDINVNYRLIYVVVRAGLEVLLQEDPFQQQSVLSEQALNSLAVIQLTIERSPEVLFFVPSVHGPGFEPGGPLYLWLLPKLLSTLGNGRDERVQEKATDLIRASLCVQSKSYTLRERLHPVFKYVQGCVKDLLFCVEASVSRPVQGSSPSRLAVPTLETVSEVCPVNLRPVDLQQSSEVRLKDIPQVIEIVLELLLLLLSPPADQVTRSRRGGLKHCDLPWMIDCLTILSSTTGIDGAHCVISQLHTRGCVLYLRALCNCLACADPLQSETVNLYKLASLLTRFLGLSLRLDSRNMHPLVANTLCWCMSDLLFFGRRSQAVSNCLSEHLIPRLSEALSNQSLFEGFANDLQYAILLALRYYGGGDGLNSGLRRQVEDRAFQNKDLETSFQRSVQVDSYNMDRTDVGRPTKRPCLSDQNLGSDKDDLESELVGKLHDLMGTDRGVDLHGINHGSLTHFANMTEEDQCSAFASIGLSACAGARTLSNPSNTRRTSYRRPRCSVCDSIQQGKGASSVWEGDRAEELFEFVAKLLKTPQLQRSTRPRIAATAALRRLLFHTASISHLNLSKSMFGQWCMQALHSSVRDLRFAAGRALPAFLRSDVNVQILRNNRILALDCLRSMSEKNELVLQESCIFAWGQIARISSDDETNIVLLRLVEYLGHTNPLVNGLAYTELQKLSGHSSSAAMRLFTPYWRTIATTVVKELQNRPQIAQQLSDLLVMSIPEFLVLTQTFTIPYLVLTKRRDILQRIAQARGGDCSLWTLCTDTTNMAAILAYLLIRPSTDIESMVIALLTEIVPEFSKVDLAELAKSEPITIATELLKAAAEDDDTKRAKAHQAIQVLANLGHRKTVPAKGLARKNDVLGPFFQQWVLGIMAHLSDIINDIRGLQPIAERKRCIGAIREMVRIARSHVANGLPQICACLQSALETPELCDGAFGAWIVMMTTLGEEDIADLIDPTFAIIAQHWPSFNAGTQEQAYEMVSHLLKSFGPLIRQVVNTTPSLATVPLMAKFEDELGKLRSQMDLKHRYEAFSERCKNENITVVTQALIELEAFLAEHESFLHEVAIGEQPDPVVALLARSVLDACVRLNRARTEVAVTCARCLGLIGCLDSNKLEAVRENREIVVLSNFSKEEETIDFVVFFLQEVLVKAFLSATNTRAQNFLGYAMQELLRFCNFDTSVTLRTRDIQSDTNYRRWVALPESVRNTLTPFLTSKYSVTTAPVQIKCVYPLYKPSMTHGTWLRDFLYDLLQKGCDENARMIFHVCGRVVRTQGIAISEFLLPFTVLHVVLGGVQLQREEIQYELLAVLSQHLPETSGPDREQTILCSQSVFRTLDYLTRWMQEKKKEVAASKNSAAKASVDVDNSMSLEQIKSVEEVLSMIPAEVISRRAVECKSYARALFHWEQYIRQQKENSNDASRNDQFEPLYERLQEIYTQIDEPDGIEGISAHLHVLNVDQQILEHRKAGRWTAAQSWYELLLAESPDKSDAQINLLTCLKESGQYEVLLNHVDGMSQCQANLSIALPFAAEAAWVTGKWDKLAKFLSHSTDTVAGDFNVSIGSAMLALKEGDSARFKKILHDLRLGTAGSLTATTTASLQACHGALLKFHVLAEIEAISGARSLQENGRPMSMATLNQRLNVLGAFLSDKQYLLGIRRAVMQLSGTFSKTELASAWLTSARLARKGDFTHQAFNAVLHATQLGDDSAMIEHSRLLWREGHHRKAIQSLEGAIAANAFRSHDHLPAEDSTATLHKERQQQQNLVTARAHLLLAKWLDKAGQTQSDVIIERYQKATADHNRWEKGHYYLGKHYNKLLESEKAKPPGKQAQTFVTGETAKLVVENYLRSLAFGAKNIYQTLPRILTLWLELGSDAEQSLDPKYGNDENFRAHATIQRKKLLAAVNTQVKKYIDRLPAFVFYTALAQIVARICHPNQKVYAHLVDMVAKVVMTHPQQSLWTLLAMVKSSSKDRASRGVVCMNKVMENAKALRTESARTDLKALMAHGQKLSDQLLQVCEKEIHGKPTNVSLTRDLGFSHKSAPCRLVIPLESTLTANLPTFTDNVNMKTHKAFSKETITISAFLDDVLVLNSLQRPRKVNIRGSDGRVYGLLCKPKDDLRKDQRLMEFNAMINRSLKKDAESSKRRLYIKTYAVTPLNEECGLIEWVDNLKTLRDIVLRSYKQKNIPINYGEIRVLLDESISDPQGSKLNIFTHQVLPSFPPVFHEWFVEMFPEPGAWFTARLKYTRSCAVMSMVGHVLGLGDRHGENILFEEGNGGTFHVDFNCLFDKGLTFEKPEVVPFRLTQNMVDAFGAYGYEGPFRKCSELTFEILRQNEDTLMTILETFLYDPTTDFIGKKKRSTTVVPDTPEGVLESVRNKVRGLLPMESVPLSVEGYVQELIRQATDPMRLASMYIGWVPFF